MKKINLEELFLEDSVFDSFTKNNRFGRVEFPLSRQVFVLMLFLIVFLGAAVVLRILYLNIWKGDFYQARAAANVGKEIYEAAPRGLIYDRFGKVLAENTTAFSVIIRPLDLIKESADENIKSLSEVLEIPAEEIKNQIKNFNPEKSSSLALSRNTDTEKIIKLKTLDLPGVEIINDYKRNYIDGSIFSSVIGYTGFGKYNEIEGKTGLEAFYNELLKGSDGKSIIYRDVTGVIFDKKAIQPLQIGQNLNAAIDAELQRYFYQRLSEKLFSSGRKAGVGIALNPQNGEILALISLPSFDNNIFAKSGNNEEKKRILNSPDNPLFDRPIAGVYTPGSTIKPLVALAALKEGIIDTQKQVYSAGYIEIPNPYDPEHPSIFRDWKAHGWVNLYSALAASSNVYFYALGGGFEDVKGLGIEKLKEYWSKFGFGEKTGIDLPNESDGFLPDPKEKEARKKDIWRIGDTYNVSIGQGDLLVTPIQLINQIAAFANGGKFYKPHLLKDAAPQVSFDFSNLENYLKEVRRGMEDVVGKSYGTGKLLASLPISAAGKTGSSQIADNTKVNAFFVGYMPAENPQIAVLVLIENAKEGSANAVPVAKNVLEWYYYNRLVKSL